jgi:hypothetical protein
MIALLMPRVARAITLAEYIAGGTPLSPTTQGWTAFEIIEQDNPTPVLATDITTNAEANAGVGTTGWTVRDFLDGNVNADLPQYLYSLSANDFSLMQNNGWKFTATVRMDGVNAGRDMRLLNLDQGDDVNNPFSIKVNARYQTGDLTSNLRLIIQQGTATMNLDAGVPASVFNTVVFEDVDGNGSFTISVNGNPLNDGLAIDSTPSSNTQITDFDLLAIGANSSGNSGGGMEYSLLRLETGSNPLTTSLVVDRDNGNIRLVNNTSVARTIVGYQITSDVGALHPGNALWKSIAENYDMNAAPAPGNGSVDPNDAWVELTEITSRDNLSELEPDGNGALFAAGQTINLGNAWIRNLSEDVHAELLLSDGTIEKLAVSFIDGPGGQPYAFGDLDFNGTFNVADFTGVFRPKFGTNTSSLSSAERYQTGDFNEDGTVDEYDFLILNDAYVTANPLASPLVFTVPEPGALIVATLLAFSYATIGCRSRQSTKLTSIASACVLCLLFGGTKAIAVPVDISSGFTTDFVATSGSEEGIGVGGSHAMLGSQAYALSSGAFTGLPDNGVVSDGTHTFALAPYTGPNVILKSLPAEQQSATFGQPPAVVDVANGSYTDLTMLFNWSSFGASGQNGAFTVTYTTGAPDIFDWKVADSASASNTNSGTTPLVIGPLNRYFAGPGAFQSNTFSIFKQTFDTDESRVIDTITFGQGSAVDNSGNNGYFAVFALDGTPFAPTSELTLEVNETTGAIYLKNSSTSSIDIDLYRVRSPGNSLFPGTWTSFDDINLDSGVWSELASSANKISEGAFGESTIFANGMTPISLGAAYNESINAKDLIFEYHISGTDATALFQGSIQYVTGGSVTTADFDSDGDIDGRDFLTWQRGFGKLPGTAGRVNGDANGDHHVNGTDLAIWQAQYGTSGLVAASIAVPEPSAIMLLVFAPLLAMLRTRRVSKGVAIAAIVGVTLSAIQAELRADATTDRDYSFGDDGEGASLGGVLGSGNGFNSTWDNAGTVGAGDLQDLSIVGDPRYANVLDRPGSPGAWGASFDGIDDYVMTPINVAVPRLVWNNTAYFPEATFPHDYSNINAQGLQLWVKPNSMKMNVRQDIIMNSGEHGVSITASNTWGLISDTPTPLNSGVPVAFDQWSHLMQVGGISDPVNGSSAAGGVLFVNGVAVAAQTATYEFNVNQPLTIGAMQLEGNLGGATPTAPANFYQGLVDDVQILLWGVNSTGTDYGTLDLAKDNEWIALQLAGIDEGDINLDGQVSGNGLGSPETDDVSALIQNWMSVQTVGDVRIGDWNSRQDGDLNFDGIVDLKDAFILRQGLINSGLGTLDFGLLTSQVVPEPASISMLLTTVLIFAVRHRT